MTLNSADSVGGSLNTQFLTPDQQQSSRAAYYAFAGAGLALGGAALLAASYWALRSIGGSLRNDLNHMDEQAQKGQISAFKEDQLRARTSGYITRFAYYLSTDNTASPLKSVVDEIVEKNRLKASEAARHASSLVDVVPSPSVVGRSSSSMMASLLDAARPVPGADPFAIPDERLGMHSIMDAPIASVRPSAPLIASAAPIGSASSSSSTAVSAISAASMVTPGSGRRVSAAPDPTISLSTPIQTQDTRIVDIWSYLVKAEQLSYSDPAKVSALNMAQYKVFQLISDGNIQSTDFDTLRNVLIPNLENEIHGAELWFAGMDGATRLTGTQSLGVQKLDGNAYTWSINFTPSGAFSQSTYFNRVNYVLMNTSKSIFVNDNFGLGKPNLNTTEVNLDSQNSQYTGSDANEIITIGGTSATTYNVVAMGGDDIIRVLSDAVSNSTVNIFGGAGKNTYVITVQGSWSKLPGTIHIWDFDPTKDSIVFASADGSRTADPRIKETKRTLFSAAADHMNQRNGDGNIFFDQSTDIDNWGSFTDTFHNLSKSSYKAAEHEFTGDGIPLLVIDEKNYDANNPDSLFNNPNVFRTDQNTEIAGSVRGDTATLPVRSTQTIQFSQLEKIGDHDFFRVHLKKGQSYVFKMLHRPDVAGDGALTTALRLTDSLGNDITSGGSKPDFFRTGDGNSRIDFFAANEGDYFLDASGTGTTATGKYAISSIEIPHESLVLGSTIAGTTNTPSSHAGYKITLNAGDYMQFGFEFKNEVDYFTKVSINNAFNDAVSPWQSTTLTTNVQTFLANKTGDYFIDIASKLGPASNFTLTNSKKEVEGSKATMAVLFENNLIVNTIDTVADHDWYQITLEGGKKYQFDMKKTAGSNLDTKITLRDTYGDVLAANKDISATDWNSRLVYTPKTSGSFYLDASGYEGNIPQYANNRTGDYNLSYKVI